MIEPHRRLHEISGRSTVDPPYTNVTLDFMLHNGPLAPVIPIQEVMNISGPVLCYDYV
jgi:tyrosinase